MIAAAAQTLLDEEAPPSAVRRVNERHSSPSCPHCYTGTATAAEIVKFADLRDREVFQETVNWRTYESRTKDSKAERERRFDLACLRAQANRALQDLARAFRGAK